MSSIPITAEDFIAIGARYASEDIVTEIDRLAPLAAADIVLLATRGYGQPELDKLKAFRDALTGESAGRTQQRGAKKGSRKMEADAIHDGKLVLRSGITVATAALTKRVAPPGEAAAETAQLVNSTMSQIDALGGRVGNDSALLRARLTTLLSILALPVLAPSADEAQARTEFGAKVQAAIKALPALAEQKKTHQQDAKVGTASLDEIDGRAYTNLKLLAKVGRAYWNEHKNRARAAEYQLNSLHEGTAKTPKTPPNDTTGSR